MSLRPITETRHAQPTTTHQTLRHLRFFRALEAADLHGRCACVGGREETEAVATVKASASGAEEVMKKCDGQDQCERRHGGGEEERS